MFIPWLAIILILWFFNALIKTVAEENEELKKRIAYLESK
jgi:hypothetical protein